MTPISTTAEQVFKELLQRLGNSDYIKLQAHNYMPLSLECIGKLVCCYGRAEMYSLMHTFTQNGDWMRDPEICFFYFEKDCRNKIIGSYPYSYQLDPLGIYQESIIIDDSGHINVLADLQKQHSEFASSWLMNIKQQGFI